MTSVRLRTPYPHDVSQEPNVPLVRPIVGHVLQQIVLDVSQNVFAAVQGTLLLQVTLAFVVGLMYTVVLSHGQGACHAARYSYFKVV